VPDPYYGVESDFELVIELLEDACEGLLDDIIKEK
jgi:protein-tyrosine phosphatase